MMSAMSRYKQLLAVLCIAGGFTFAAIGAGAQQTTQYAPMFGDLTLDGAPAAGATLSLAGQGFGGGEMLQLTLRSNLTNETVSQSNHEADPAGNFLLTYSLPAELEPGSYTVTVNGFTVDALTLELTTGFDIAAAAGAPTTTAATPLVRTPSTVLNTGEPDQGATAPDQGSTAPESTPRTTVAAPSTATVTPSATPTTAGPPNPPDDESTAGDDSDLGDLIEHAARPSTSAVAPAGEGDTITALPAGGPSSTSSGGALVWGAGAALVVALFAGLWRVRRGSWTG